MVGGLAWKGEKRHVGCLGFFFGPARSQASLGRVVKGVGSWGSFLGREIFAELQLWGEKKLSFLVDAFFEAVNLDCLEFWGLFDQKRFSLSVQAHPWPFRYV